MFQRLLKHYLFAVILASQYLLRQYCLATSYKYYIHNIYQYYAPGAGEEFISDMENIKQNHNCHIRWYIHQT